MGVWNFFFFFFFGDGGLERFKATLLLTTLNTEAFRKRSF